MVCWTGKGMRRRDEQTRILKPSLRVVMSDSRSGMVLLGPQGGQVKVHLSPVGQIVSVALDDLVQDSRDDLLATAVEDGPES